MDNFVFLDDLMSRSYNDCYKICPPPRPINPVTPSPTTEQPPSPICGYMAMNSTGKSSNLHNFQPMSNRIGVTLEMHSCFSKALTIKPTRVQTWDCYTQLMRSNQSKTRPGFNYKAFLYFRFFTTDDAKELFYHMEVHKGVFYDLIILYLLLFYLKYRRKKTHAFRKIRPTHFSVSGIEKTIRPLSSNIDIFYIPPSSHECRRIIIKPLL